MKKTISILLALFLFAALACYAPHGEESTVVVNDLPGVYCEIVEGTLTPEGAEVRFWNTMDREDLNTWPKHYLEQEHWGKWYPMEIIAEVPVDTPAWFVPPESMQRDHGYQIRWNNAYGSLEPGYYRILFEIYEQNDPNHLKHFVAAEFTIR